MLFSFQEYIMYIKEIKNAQKGSGNSFSGVTPWYRFSLSQRKLLWILTKVIIPAWLFCLVVMGLLKAGWAEYMASTIGILGIGVSWVVVIIVLNRRDPKYIEEMLAVDHPDDEVSSKPH